MADPTAARRTLGSGVPLDAPTISNRKRAKRIRLNTVTMPAIRLAGFALLSLSVFLHNRFISRQFSWDAWAALSGAFLVYALGSWLMLRLWYPRLTRFDLQAVFLVADLAGWAAAVYATGGTRSLAFFIFIFRVADQLNTTLRRVMVFAHLAPIAYAALVFYVVRVDGQAVDLTSEVAKVALLYLAGLYIALPARAANRRRNNATAAIRLSRRLIREAERRSEELEEARARAEAARSAKSEFVAKMSHDVRTPLNAIAGMTELALQTPLSSDQRHYLQVVKSSCRSLLALLDDVIDSARLEARKLQLEEIPFTLTEAIGDVLQAQALNADVKGLELIAAIDPSVPEALIGDGNRLRQIVSNLVSNAIKFTMRGEVLVRVELETRTPESVTLQVSVADTGIGVPVERRRAIFEAFTQADRSVARTFGGSGLGLNIAAELVRLMNGRLWLTGEAGSGSTFHFTATFGLGPVAPPVGSVQARRLVIVEPNPRARAALSAAVRSWGVEVDELANTAEAMDLLRASRAAGPQIDVLLLDGGEVDAAIATLEAARAVAPAVHVIPFLRIGSLHAAAARFDAAGIRRFLIKPVLATELRDVLTGPRSAALPPELAVRSVAPRRVLLVEDNALNQMVAAVLLKRRGHHVTIAGDGEQALVAASREPFDIILMDLQLPGRDGLEMTGALREAAARNGWAPRIFAMTARVVEGQRQACLAAGMDGFLAKPVPLGDLYATVEAETRAPARASAAGDDVRARILATAGGDSGLARDLVAVFMAEAPRLVSSVKEALATKDAVRVHRAAHQLTGAVAHVGAPDALDAARGIEALAAEGRLGEFAHEFARVEQQLDALRATLPVEW